MNQRDRSEIGAAPDASSAGKHVHMTFSFHCAVVRLPDKRRTDVLLSPGMRHGVGVGTACGNGAAASGAHDASGRAHREPAHSRWSASRSGRAHPGFTQITTRLDRPESADVTWRLEEHDVVLRTGSQAAAANRKEPPANIGLTTAVAM